MHQLRTEVSLMRPTTSAGQDNISFRMVKAAFSELEPLLLNLVNQCIATTTFPDVLKTTKIIPIQKKDKDKTTSDAWRPINIVPALSKIIECVLMRQILKFLQENDLINHSHHGGLKSKSTQTLILEVHDGLVESLSSGNDAALLILDQSKAYDIIQHSILLDKLRILGFKNQSLNLVKSFLLNRKQYVQVQGKDSDILLSGHTSVIQGSTLSGILFLIHILDMPYIHHTIIHKPREYKLCPKPNTKTFIDDSLVKVNEEQDIPIEQTIKNTMDLIEEYTSANKLCLNPQKTQIMLITKDKVKKQHLKSK